VNAFLRGGVEGARRAVELGESSLDSRKQSKKERGDEEAKARNGQVFWKDIEGVGSML
jgi:hypothetical protein